MLERSQGIVALEAEWQESAWRRKIQLKLRECAVRVELKKLQRLKSAARIASQRAAASARKTRASSGCGAARPMD
jgi:hypothetical protein